jgi:Ca2+-binding RTX toxin-like protein
VNHRRPAALSSLAVALVLVGSASPAAAFHDGYSSCTYSAGVVRLVMASQHVVRLLVVSGQIHYSDLDDNRFGGQCGSATVNNTDLIRVWETVAGTTRLFFDQSLARFGPGRTLESAGLSEIEVKMPTVTDLELMGRPTRDVVRVGTTGVDLNGDGDVDIIGSSLHTLWAYLDDGNDYFSAAGGRGTGDRWIPVDRGLAVRANDGNDTISGTPRIDLLDGEAGEDRVSGAGGADTLYGGSHVDVLTGGSGNDFIDPGPWSDTVVAGEGDDHIRAADSTADHLDGGPGNDRAIIDQADTVVGVESTSLGAP